MRGITQDKNYDSKPWVNSWLRSVRGQEILSLFGYEVVVAAVEDAAKQSAS